MSAHHRVIGDQFGRISGATSLRHSLAGLRGSRLLAAGPESFRHRVHERRSGRPILLADPVFGGTASNRGVASSRFCSVSPDNSGHPATGPDGDRTRRSLPCGQRFAVCDSRWDSDKFLNPHGFTADGSFPVHVGDQLRWGLILVAFEMDAPTLLQAVLADGHRLCRPVGPFTAPQGPCRWQTRPIVVGP